jgi:hypothetical protein
MVMLSMVFNLAFVVFNLLQPDVSRLSGREAPVPAGQVEIYIHSVCDTSMGAKCRIVVVNNSDDQFVVSRWSIRQIIIDESTVVIGDEAFPLVDLPGQATLIAEPPPRSHEADKLVLSPHVATSLSFVISDYVASNKLHRDGAVAKCVGTIYAFPRRRDNLSIRIDSSSALSKCE